MRLISSYQIKLTGNLEALEASIDIYRQVLSYLIPIINHNWDKVDTYSHDNQKRRLIYGLIPPLVTEPALILTSNFRSCHAILDVVRSQVLLASFLLIVVTLKTGKKTQTGKFQNWVWPTIPIQLITRGIYLKILTQSITPLNSKCSKMGIGFMRFIDWKPPIAPITSVI